MLKVKVQRRVSGGDEIFSFNCELCGVIDEFERFDFNAALIQDAIYTHMYSHHNIDMNVIELVIERSTVCEQMYVIGGVTVKCHLGQGHRSPNLRHEGRLPLQDHPDDVRITWNY